MAHGLPREGYGVSSERFDRGRTFELSEAPVPNSWTNGDVGWTDLLAGRHNFPEHINVFVSRVLFRSFHVAAKIPQLRRSRILALCDNSVSHFNNSRGRSSKWNLNKQCRVRTALELAANIECMTAWVRSSRMPMDTLSRAK